MYAISYLRNGCNYAPERMNLHRIRIIPRLSIFHPPLYLSPTSIVLKQQNVSHTSCARACVCMRLCMCVSVYVCMCFVVVCGDGDVDGDVVAIIVIVVIIIATIIIIVIIC